MGPEDREWQEAYEEGKEIAESWDVDDIAGSGNEGDEAEYFAEQWADQDE